MLSVKFQHIECINPQWSDDICVIGRCGDGKSVCAILDDVKPHVCVRNELGYSAGRFEAELNAKMHLLDTSKRILNQLKKPDVDYVVNFHKRINDGEEYVKVTSFPAQDIVDYNESGNVEFFRLTVNSKRHLYTLKSVLKNASVHMVEKQLDFKRKLIASSERAFYKQNAVTTCTIRKAIGINNTRFTLYNEQVDFMLQYFIDHDLYSCGWMEAKGKAPSSKLTSCDIELVASSIAPAESSSMAPWRIFSYDIESLPRPRGNTGKYDFPQAVKDPVVTVGGVLEIGEAIKQYVWILRPFGEEVKRLPAFETKEDYAPETTEVFDFANEAKLLEHFFQWCVAMDVDLIQGHNCNRFDNRYMLDRYKALMDDAPVWGRLVSEASTVTEKSFSSSQKGTNKQYKLHLPGRVVFDSYDIMKDQHNEGSYKLDNLAEKYLGTKKVEMDYDQIYPKFHTLQGRTDLAVYCVKDAWLVYKLLNKLCKLTVISQMSNVTGISMKDVMGRGQGIRTIALMLRYAKRRDPQLMLPRLDAKAKTRTVRRFVKNTRDELSLDEVEVEVAQSFKGAVVVDPDAGFYTDAVSCLDFASLYPSIMQAMNMSYETICYRAQVESMGWKQDVDVRTIPDYELVDGRLETTVNPNNPSFIVKEKRLGLLPEILETLLSERKRVKKLMKKCVPHSTMYKVHDGTQLALKVCCNSIYGFTGASFGFLPCKDIAQGVTKYGRGLTLKTKSLIENHPEWGRGGHGCKCVYGDSVSGNTPLLIKTGHHIEIVRIKDLTLTDPVYTWTEQGWTRVENIIKHELATHKRMLRITTHGGIVHCTSDHSLVTAAGEAICPDDVKVGTELMHSFPEEYPGMVCVFEYCVIRKFVYKSKEYESGREAALANGLHSQPSSGVWVFKSRKITVDANVAELFGMFMGDGSCGTYGTGTKVKSTWAINNSNMSLLVRYQQIASLLFPEMNFKILDTIKSSKVFKLIAQCNQHGSVRRFCDIWRTLFYNDDREKVVPNIILNSHPDVRQSFLNGLHDADGTKNAKEYEISHKGQQACEGIYYLLRSLGHQVVVDGRMDKQNIFRLRARAQPRAKMNKVKKIVEIPYEKYVYDLTTENHHFHAGIGNMIVHNTDSVFVHMPRSLVDGKTNEETVEKAHEMGEVMADYVTKFFLPPVFLEYEKTYLPYLLLKKKRYVGMKNEPGLPRKLHIKGLESVRRDFAPLLVDTQKRVLDALIREQDQAKACEIIRDVVRKLQMNEIPLEMLIMSKKLSRPVEQYSAKAPHVQLTKRLLTENPEKAPVPGDRVPFVIYCGSGGSSDRACTPAEIRSGKFSVDRRYYMEKQLEKPLLRIMERVVTDPGKLFLCRSMFKDGPGKNSVFGSWEKSRRPQKRKAADAEETTTKKKNMSILSFFKK